MLSMAVGTINVGGLYRRSTHQHYLLLNLVEKLASVPQWTSILVNSMESGFKGLGTATFIWRDKYATKIQTIFMCSARKTPKRVRALWTIKIRGWRQCVLYLMLYLKSLGRVDKDHNTSNIALQDRIKVVGFEYIAKDPFLFPLSFRLDVYFLHVNKWFVILTL